MDNQLINILLDRPRGWKKMSSFEGLEEPWGQLVSIDTEKEEERYPIIDKQFTIGRKPGTP